MRGVWRVAAAAAVVALTTTGGCTWIARVSVGTGGAEAQGGSGEPALSFDGRYVAFVSHASNLVPGDTNGTGDVFVRNTVGGTTTLVSVGMSGGAANAFSHGPSISADGRFVAFWSTASNLVADDTNGVGDVFVHDRASGATIRVSVDGAGVQGDRESRDPSLSADGRRVVFESDATNLVPGDTNGDPDVFLHDLGSGTTTRVSTGVDGAEVDGGGYDAVLSGNGRFVAFHSWAELVAEPLPEDDPSTYLHDTATGTTELIGTGAVVDGDRPAVSADGRFVAYTASSWSQERPDDEPDIFVLDRATGVVDGVSADDVEDDRLSWGPSISADGRFVAFWTSDGSDSGDVLVHDRHTGTTTVANADFLGRVGSGDHDWHPVLSGDGRYVAFGSSAGELVPGDTNGEWDVFVRANPTPLVASVAPATLPRGTTTEVVITGTGFDDDAIVLLDGQGLTVTSTEVQSPFEIHAEITVAPSAPTGTRNLFVQHPGTGPGPGAMALGGCAACLTVG